MIEWINQTFGIENDVSVPTLISIIVFLIGGLTTFLFTKLRELNDRKRTRKTIILLLKEVLSDLKAKELNTSEFYKTINVEHRKSWYYPHKPISYLETLFELDFNQTYYSFRRKFFWECSKKLKEKSFHRIWAILRNLRFMEEKLEKHIENMMSRFNEYHSRYMEALDDFRKVHDDFKRRTNGMIIPKSEKRVFDYIKAVDQIWLEWQKMDEKDRTAYFNTYNKLVMPMLELNRKNSDVPYTAETDNLLLACTYQYIEIENTLNIYNRTFKNYYWNYRHQKRILEKCIELIK